MYSDLPSQQGFRVKIQVPKANYRALVARLRGEDGLSPFSGQTLPNGTVTALLDIDPQSNSFFISRLGHHKLPQSVRIRQGSPTHIFLAHSVLNKLESSSDSVLRERLCAIIDACPEPLPLKSKVSPNDFELTQVAPLSRRSDTLNNPDLALTTIISETIRFDLDDLPTLVVPDVAPLLDSEILKAIHQALTRTTRTSIRVSDNSVEINLKATLPALPKETSIKIFAHWGSYDELTSPWQDELLNPKEELIQQASLQQIQLSCSLYAPIHGSYGATFYAVINSSSERLWIGRPWLDDVKFEITRDDPSRLLNLYRDSSAFRASARSKAQQLVSDLGVGEIVFATPEGPHAAAGGLAQVITGLPPELNQLGVPVTIISPLYRYSNGNKHSSAEELLKHGVRIGGQTLTPRYVTTVSSYIGPTHYIGTGYTKRPATNIPCKIYIAESGSLRLILIANSSCFDRLYQPVYPDEQLRRALVFSRACLEVIATEGLDINPSVIISNDWMTAPISALHALDPRYKDIKPLKDAKVAHMIHNGGADYHGRLPTHFGDEDLWPLFGLAPEHFFGFRDPHRSDLLNLTMAASRHSNGGVITVSAPYAKSLTTPGCGDGLELVLEGRQDSVFGLSNGINRADVDRFMAAQTGRSKMELANPREMLNAKRELLVKVQHDFGLRINSNARLLSFVGRLAEQKGLDLLSGWVDFSARSTLEELLKSRPDTQIIIAGPVTAGDRSAESLRDAVRYLEHRYPGRIASTFDYISHSLALKIIAASSLFLMPSRFEPGGITQLEALAVGTPVIGRNVGGIAATIDNFDPLSGSGTGFLCNDYSATAFKNTIFWALSVCDDPLAHESIVRQAISAKHSWADRAPAFLSALQSIYYRHEIN
jgi:starch synthase